MAFRRIFLVFLALVSLQILLGEVVPLVHWDGPLEAERVIVTFLSRHLFQVMPTGTLEAPDAQISWFLLLWMFVAAVVAGAASGRGWGADDSRKRGDDVRMLVRYAIAAVLFDYGLDKLYLSHQFPFPSPSGLIETYADSAPNALVWRFMGASPVFSMLTGAVEALGALLLCWRRTATVGALLVAALMTHILALNLFYGIGAKLLAMELLAMAVFLAAPQGTKVLAFLVLERPLEVAETLHPRPGRWEGVGRVGRAALVGAFVLATIGKETRIEARIGEHAPRPALWGVYDVEELRRGGQPVPLLAGDPDVWQEVGFGRDNGVFDVCIVTLDGARHIYPTVYDESRGTVSIQKPEQAADSFAVRRLDATHVELDSNSVDNPVAVRLRWRDMSSARLLTSRFRWIQDQSGDL
jgi:hypothetical protein